ncbi:MAG: cupin domain-containing protein [Thermoleophilia bacterium]
MRVRRVVTGHTADGRSVVASDEQVEPIEIALWPGAEFHSLWGGDETPTFPDDGARPPAPGWFPGPGGYRFLLFTLPAPTAEAPPPLAGEALAAARAEADEKLPGLFDLIAEDDAPFHRSETVDLLLVVSGTCELLLDDEVAVPLGPGDTIVQNATRHAWRATGEAPCTLLAINVGAHWRA